jgi:hypothetical protein
MTTLYIENALQRTHKSMRGWFVLACLDPKGTFKIHFCFKGPPVG